MKNNPIAITVPNTCKKFKAENLNDKNPTTSVKIAINKAIEVNMVFNAAMNSIPVLLLAIGVDYGLHVVLRIREELKNSQEASQGTQNMTMRDFSVEARKLAIRRGTIFTSIALLIAIFTDVVGFLSFRFSALNFLQVFGTVIAIGLFFIYLLSITALPALMSLIPPKRLPPD